MTMQAQTMGHKIEYDELKSVWIYSDTENSIDSEVRTCRKCGRCETENGHDPCISNLPNVKHACCGHGVDCGYLMTVDNITIRFGKNEDELIKETANELNNICLVTQSVLANFTSTLNPNDRISITKESDTWVASLFAIDSMIFRGRSLSDTLTDIADKLVNSSKTQIL